MTHPLIQAAAGYWSIPVEDILGSRRYADLVKARGAIAYVLRHRDRLSYPAIGRRLGGRDHSTIISVIEKCEIYLNQADFKTFVDAQMASEARSTAAVFVHMPPPLPPCPPHLVRLRKERQFEVVKPSSGRRFRMDENGDCPDDDFTWEAVATGSRDLIAALRREHPERCAA